MRFASCLALAAFLPLAAPVASAATMFSATLSGDQEAPTPVATAAFGSAQLVLNDAMDALSIHLSITGIALADFGGGHLHRAPRGANGPVVFGFQHPNNDLDGDTVITELADGFTLVTVWDGAEGNATTLADELASLFASGLYLNIHTPSFPSGELRGQVEPVPLPAAGLLLVGALGALGVAARRRSA